MKLELKAKQEVSLAADKTGPKAWDNRCRWADMIREDIAAMFVPYSCIHKGGFGGVTAILKMLEPHSAEICLAVENGTVEAKMAAWLSNMRKTITGMEEEITAFGVESKESECEDSSLEAGADAQVVVRADGEAIDSSSKTQKLSDTGVQGIGVGDLSAQVSEVHNLEAQCSEAPISPELGKSDGSGSKRLRERSDDAENQLLVVTTSPRNGSVTHVLQWAEETLQRLKQVGELGNDEIIDLGVALLNLYFPGAIVSALNSQVWRQSKSVPRFALEVLKWKFFVMPWYFEPQKHFVAVCVVDANSSYPQIFVYDDLPGFGQHEMIAIEIICMIEMAQGGKLAEWDIQTCLHSVPVTRQVRGSNECYLSTVLNMVIVVATGATSGPLFQYDQIRRNQLRASLLAIAEWQKRENNAVTVAIPPEMIEAFKSCIMGLARVEIGGAVAELTREQPIVVGGAESEPKRAKTFVVAETEVEEQIVEAGEGERRGVADESDQKRLKIEDSLEYLRLVEKSLDSEAFDEFY
jgi:hypothetical protein